MTKKRMERSFPRAEMEGKVPRLPQITPTYVGHMMFVSV